MPGVRARVVACCVAASAAGALAAPATAQQARLGDASNERFAPGEAIVRFEPGTSAGERRDARDTAGVAFGHSLGIARAQVVRVRGSVVAAVRRLAREPGVAYAQPNFRYQALSHAPDTFLGSLWGLGDSAAPDPGVDAQSAWTTTRGAGQVIAVADTGVDLTHPDIEPNLWSNPGELPGNGVDDDANGVVDDVHGADFADRGAGGAATGDPDDFNFHGTHVAGTATAQDDNGIGIAGVAPDAQVMAVRVLDGDGGGFSEDIGQGIAYAAREGADVINLSLGGPGATDEFMSDGVDAAAQNDAVVVAAAGNDGFDNDDGATPFVPCNLPQPNLVCVAAVNQSGNRASFSNYGAQSVDLAAPGTNVLSAKTDWGSPLIEDGFDTSLDPWDRAPAVGAAAWDRTNATGKVADGTHSVTDSPAGNYGNNANSQLFTANAVDLTGRRGCRMHFDLAHEVQAPASNGTLRDALLAGAVTDDPDVDQLVPFAGSSGGFFDAEVSISRLSGRSDVFPIFALLSNADNVGGDGAYVDRLRLFCRDSTYVNATTSVANYDQPASGNYVAFQGTSMATPHVSGVAALVRAADPGAPATQVARAIIDGASPLASLNGITASGGVANAPRAIAEALAAPNPQPQAQAPTGGSGGGTTTTPAPPAKAILPARAVADRTGRFRIRVTGQPGTTGGLRMTANVGRASVVRSVVRKTFSVGISGRVTLRLRLTRAARRVLVRAKRLRTRARVVLTDPIGLRSTSTRIVVIRLRR